MSDTYVDDVIRELPIGHRTSGYYASRGKRFCDILAVLLIAPIILPFLLCVFLVTSLDGGKIIYGQRRIGLGGRIFKCWKIRTMVPDAEKVLARILETDAELAREWLTNQKLESDPRITKFGRLFRKASIDELPQLWNVLIGEMSLIGPRPFTPSQKDLYDAAGTNLAYYRLRPGISGLWQVTRRNQGEFKERALFDEEYARTITFVRDTKIAFQTVSVVLRGTGK
jgi:exopolysaccharide production protein ExoY